MDVVDTHCHAGTSWFEPIETLLAEMDLHGVGHALLTQHRGMYDNAYLLECIARYPGRFSAIVGVEAADPAAPQQLAELAKHDGVCGVRLLPTDRSPGDDPAAVWKAAGAAGLPVSVFLVNTAHAADQGFQELINSLDGVIVLEHLCGMYAPRSPESVQPPYENYRTALTLASRPNTYVKFGGIGEFGERPARLVPELRFAEGTPPAMEMAYDAFGPQRMMWGSDFPPVAAREGYGNSLTGTLPHPVFKSDDERDWAFGKTALQAFRVSR